MTAFLPNRGCGCAGRPTEGTAPCATIEAFVVVDPPAAGLCETCRHARLVTARRSTFVLCGRGLTDPAYPKYPPLPVRACAGCEPRPDDGRQTG
jgi:hypothetical protein